MSSFGYSGVIAHAVLQCTPDGAPAADSLPLSYQRRAFPWFDFPHPFAQRHLPSSTDDAHLFRSPTAGALCALVANHVILGRVIFPGAGYLEVARAAASSAEAPLALHGVYFLQPLATETPELHVECTVSGGRFEVRSGVDDNFVDAPVNCSGALVALAQWEVISLASARAHSGSRAADAEALYNAFASAGLQYGPGFRTLGQMFGGGNDALARLRSRLTHEGTHVHPADLDDALCASVITASSGGGGETRVPFAVDDALLQGAARKLWAVRCYFRTPP